MLNVFHFFLRLIVALAQINYAVDSCLHRIGYKLGLISEKQNVT